MDTEWDPETIFDVLGNEHVRQILALASVRPVSADELAAHTDASQPTIYRRVNVLQEHDMLTEQRQLDDEGNHYKTYRTTLDEVRFAVEDGGFTVEVALRRDLVERFSEQSPEVGADDAADVDDLGDDADGPEAVVERDAGSVSRTIRTLEDGHSFSGPRPPSTDGPPALRSVKSHLSARYAEKG